MAGALYAPFLPFVKGKLGEIAGRAARPRRRLPGSRVVRRTRRRPTVENPAGGSHQELGRALEAEFLFEMRAMGLDRLGAETETGRDFLGPQPGPEETEHLELAIGQDLHGRIGGARRGPTLRGEGSQESIGDRVTHPHSACQHLAQRFQDHLDALALGHVAARAAPDGPRCEDRFVMHRKDQYRKLLMRAPDLTDDVETVRIAQDEVHDDGVGLQFIEGALHLDRVGDLGTYPEIRLIIEDARQTIADDRMPVDNDDPLSYFLVRCFHVAPLFCTPRPALRDPRLLTPPRGTDWQIIRGSRGGQGGL